MDQCDTGREMKKESKKKFEKKTEENCKWNQEETNKGETKKEHMNTEWPLSEAEGLFLGGKPCSPAGW